MANNSDRKSTNTIPAGPPSQQGNFEDIAQELLLNRKKYQAQREQIQLKEKQNKNLARAKINKPDRSNNNIPIKPRNQEEEISKRKNIDRTTKSTENEDQNESRYETDWGGAGESSNQYPDKNSDQKSEKPEIAQEKDSKNQKSQAPKSEQEKEDNKNQKKVLSAKTKVPIDKEEEQKKEEEKTKKSTEKQTASAEPEKENQRTFSRTQPAPAEKAKPSTNKNTIKTENTQEQARSIKQSRLQRLKKLRANNKKNKSSEEKAVEKIGKQATSKILTGLWAGVWFDWTFLTLINLHLYLFATLFTDKIAQFGEDAFGKMIPGKTWAKYTEIMILFAIDAVIISLLLFIIYVLYRAYTMGIWDKTMTIAKFLLGDTEGAVEQVVD